MLLQDDRQKYGTGKLVVKSYQALKKKYENHVKNVVEDYGDEFKISNAPSKTREVTPEEAKQILKVVDNYEIPFGGTEGTLDRLFQYELEMVAAGKKPQKLNHWWFAVDDSTDDYVNSLTPDEGLFLALDFSKKSQKPVKNKKRKGGMLQDDRQKYGIGGAILKIASKFKKKAEVKANKEIDESTRQMKLDNLDSFDFEEAATMFNAGDISLADVNKNLKAAGYPTRDVEEFVYILSDMKGKSPSALIKERKEIIKKQDEKAQKNRNPDNMTDEELEKEYDRLADEFAIDNSRFEKKRGGLLSDDRYGMNEGGMLSDDDMENNYTRFIMDEALNEEEEDMLVTKLEQDKELQMLFDKVIDVAQEFAGNGPVEGPGTGVSDDIPARLSDGEFVFTAKAVEEIGEDTLMSMMKDAEAAADKRQGLAEGGMLEETKTKNLLTQSGIVQDDTIAEDELKKRMVQGSSSYVRS
jgi:hypothetical protein